MRGPDTLALCGTHLIEAAAGTGKTHTIGTLYLRLLLERDLPVDRILVVTYTVAATAELRERIRTRLVGLEDRLRQCLAGEADETDLDGDLRLARARVAAGHGARDRARVAAAIRGFDRAAVFTIHGFCKRVLDEHAFESGGAFDRELLLDPSALLEEVADDFYADTLYRAPLPRLRHVSRKLTPTRLVEIARRAMASPDALVLPEHLVAPDLAALEASWRERFDEVAALWRASGEEILEQLVDASRRKVIDGNNYRWRSLAEKWTPRMEALIAEATPDLESRWTQVRRLTRRGLEMHWKDREQPLPDHPFFDRCDELLTLDRELVAAWDAWRLAREHEFLAWARAELARRKRERNAVFFDDLLLGLRDALAGDGGDALAAAIRQRLPVALIDEFQDTDPIQYEIFRRIWHREAPGAPDSSDPRAPLLCLIGDPKQAIYAFRGADVHAYLEAREDAGENVYRLERNYRSDPSLVHAVDAVFGAHPDPFANPRIHFQAIEPAPAARDRLAGDGRGSGLRMLFVPQELASERGSGWLERAVAGEVARLLAAGLRIDDRPLTPGDIAVLTRKNLEARNVQTALRELGIVSVLQSEESVFATDEAVELERVMRAMAEPEDPARLRAALATTLLSVSADELASLAGDEAAGSARWEDLGAGFRSARRVWTEQGFVQALRRLWAEQGVGQRLLARADGERRVTNLLHLGELLQQAAVEGRFGPLALIHWFAHRRLEARDRGRFAAEEAQLRLESDDDAVQLVTVHRSKGLQYPVTVCPFLWQGRLLFARSETLSFHDPESGRPCLELRPDEPASQELARYEAFAENLRILYVALTRARHHCSVVWGAFPEAGTSPLGHLLHPVPEPRDAPTPLPDPDRLEGLPDASLLADLDALAARAPGAIRVERFGAAPPGVRATPARDPRDAEALASRRATRRFSGAWRVSSFSGLVAGAPAEEDGVRRDGLRIDPESEEGRDYDARLAGEGAPGGGTDGAERIRLADFPAGVTPGILIHEIFEHVDFPEAARPGPSELDARVAAGLARRGIGAQWQVPLAAAVRDVLSVPLEPGQPTSRLAEIQRRDRIDEMGFVLPVRPRAEGGGRLTPEGLAATFDRHATHALTRRYAERAARLDFPALEGYLRGYIDLVFRRDGRFHVVDYKSNWLGTSPGDYEPEALARSMLEHDYVLQYHLYLVALHRHLRQRLPGYDYDRHVGGAFYLFVRGIAPRHPPGRGVFHDRPPRALVEALEEQLT